MNNFGKFASVLVAAAALFVLAIFAFVWIFCRVYVGPGEMAIVTSKTGDELPPGAILAEPGQKGVQRIPLGEGRHFLNPVKRLRNFLQALKLEGNGNDAHGEDVHRL